MPGIAGIITMGKADGLRDAVAGMARAMEHEPSCASGVYVDERLGLGMGWVNRRDRADSGVPLWNETGDVCVLFSGEDFSDPAEAAGLRARGHRWEPGTAAHIVHLYEENGPAFVGKLNGRFSGLVIDLREPSAYLFNDRYGLDKLFVYRGKDAFYFSSEAKAILAVRPELRRIDMPSLAETFSCGCVLQNRTIFSGVGLLPGGSLWKFTPGRGPEETSYFRPEMWERQDGLDGAAYYDRLKETWARILPRYIRDQGRIAVSLTGGKDSRMIMAWAGAAPGGLPCYTFGGMYRDSQDVLLGRRIAAACGQPHQVIPVGGEFLSRFPSLAEKTVDITDGAMDVSGAAELYVNEIARRIAPIRLTGNYAQEVLYACVDFKPACFNESLLDGEFARLVRGAAETYAAELSGNRLTFVAFKQVPWYHTSRLALERSQITPRSPYLDNDLVALAYRRPAGPAGEAAVQLRLTAEGNAALAGIGTDRALLHRAAPLWTAVRHCVREFSFKAEYAYDYGMPQWLARLDGAVKPLHLERLFLGRHKFNHFRVWYRDALAPYVKEILLDPQTLKRPYIDGPHLEKAVLAHLAGRGNYTSEIHRLLTTELIQRRFVECGHERPARG